MTDDEQIDTKAIFERYFKGECEAGQVVEEYIAHLCIGIENIDHLLHPDVVILGGGLSYQGEQLLELINSFFKNRHHMVRRDINVRLAHFQNDAGVVGAALLDSFCN
jgi:glucokinase